MSMKDLLNGECGQVNPVLRVASHFSGAGSSSSGQSVAPIHIVGRGDPNNTALLHENVHSGVGRLGPPTTFRMDSLLKEIQSLDRTQAPSQAPRVADLARSEDWVREFRSSSDRVEQNWTEEYRNQSDPLLDPIWEPPNGNTVFQRPGYPMGMGARPLPIQTERFENSALGNAKEILQDASWPTEYEQQSRTELMATAEEFVNSMSDPNIKATDFMQFVEKLSTGESKLETANNESEKVRSWINEYEVHNNQSTDANTWSQQYTDVDSDTMTPNERQEFWQKLQSEWDKVAEESGFQHPWLTDSAQHFEQQYRFEEENPYKETENPLEEGRRRLQASDIPAASLLFEAAVQQQPENPEAWYLLGTTQALNENDPSAISALTKCIDLQPDNLKAILTLAASLTNESFYLQACIMLKKWLKQNPKYSDLVPGDIERLPSNSSLLPNNELASVQNLYIKAVRKNPVHDLDPDVQCGLGILFNLSSDYDKAADCFQAAANADPNNALLWNRLGATLANGGKPAEAIGAYSRALEIIPGFIRTRSNLGIACVNLGAYKEAAEHFLSALNMQAASKSTVPTAVDVKTMSDSIWTSLRMVLHLLDKAKLSSAIDKRDLHTLNREFGVA